MNNFLNGKKYVCSAYGPFFLVKKNYTLIDNLLVHLIIDLSKIDKDLTVDIHDLSYLERFFLPIKLIYNHNFRLSDLSVRNLSTEDYKIIKECKPKINILCQLFPDKKNIHKKSNLINI